MDWRCGFVRTFTVTDASSFDERHLVDFLSKDSICSKVRGDNAYFNSADQKHLKDNGFFSIIHRKKSKGKIRDAHILRANGKWSKITSAVDRMFAA